MAGVRHDVEIVGAVDAFQTFHYAGGAPEAAESRDMRLPVGYGGVGVAVEEHDGAWAGVPVKFLLAGDRTGERHHAREVESLGQTGDGISAVADVIFSLKGRYRSRAGSACYDQRRIDVPFIGMFDSEACCVAEVHHSSVYGSLKHFKEVDGRFDAVGVELL